MQQSVVQRREFLLLVHGDVPCSPTQSHHSGSGLAILQACCVDWMLKVVFIKKAPNNTHTWPVGVKILSHERPWAHVVPCGFLRTSGKVQILHFVSCPVIWLDKRQDFYFGISLNASRPFHSHATYTALTGPFMCVALHLCCLLMSRRSSFCLHCASLTFWSPLSFSISYTTLYQHLCQISANSLITS